jgi:hypothetical protein
MCRHERPREDAFGSHLVPSRVPTRRPRECRDQPSRHVNCGQRELHVLYPDLAVPGAAPPAGVIKKYIEGFCLPPSHNLELVSSIPPAVSERAGSSYVRVNRGKRSQLPLRSVRS